MIREAIDKVVQGTDLTEAEGQACCEEIMSGQATEAQIASLLTALRMKGETAEEITGFVRVMRDKVTKIDAGSAVVVDTCGTGGDAVGTFNISTAAALVVASCGVTVAKHGNRSVSSHCGSADVLKQLGVKLEAESEALGRCFREANIAFLFAPLLHKAMKYAIGPRREIGIRTVFNIMGPLTNPAGAERQVMGVYDAKLAELVAQVLATLGAVRAFVVHGEDGLDEASTTAETLVCEVDGGSVKTYRIKPETFGLARATLDDLKCSGAEEGAQIIRGVLEGRGGPHRDIVLLNSAFGVLAGDAVGSIEEGIAKAAEAIDAGRAAKTLEALVRASNS